MTSPSPRPSPRNLAQAFQDLDEQGYCIISDVLSPSQTAALKERLVAQAEGERSRGLEFRDGGPTRPNQRIWMLLNKGRGFRDLMLMPIVDEIMGRLLGPNYLLSSFTANIAHPGGEPMALHTDQGYVGFWTPRPVVANIAWMLDDFTEENGGTRLAPGSHLRQIQPRSSAHLPQGLTDSPAQRDTLAACGSAGSILCFDGRLWHGTGANRTKTPRHALLSYHCAPFIRQQENFTLGLAPELRVSERPALLNRLGFAPWAGLGRVESPVPQTPLYEATGAIGALSAAGDAADA